MTVIDVFYSLQYLKIKFFYLKGGPQQHGAGNGYGYGYGGAPDNMWDEIQQEIEEQLEK